MTKAKWDDPAGHPVSQTQKQQFLLMTHEKDSKLCKKKYSSLMLEPNRVAKTGEQIHRRFTCQLCFFLSPLLEIAMQFAQFVLICWLITAGRVNLIRHCVHKDVYSPLDLLHSETKDNPIRVDEHNFITQCISSLLEGHHQENWQKNITQTVTAVGQIN